MFMRHMTIAGIRAVSILLVPVHVMATTPMPAGAAERPVTLDDLRAAYPGLNLREVSRQEFNEVTRSPFHVAQLIVTPETLEPRVTHGELPALAEPPSGTNIAGSATNRTPSVGYAAARDSDYARARSRGGGGSIDFWGVGNVDSKEAAIVVFVIAGAVVVAAAVIYSGILLANLALRPDDAPPAWIDAGVRVMGFSGGSQQGYMAGGAIALGLQGDDADVGLVVEGGHLDADVVTIDNDEIDVSGSYVMAGPTVRWHLDLALREPIFEAELLAGTASNYDLISRASFAFTWRLAGPWRAGLRFGALYLDVDRDEGPVLKAGDDFNFLGGLETSVRF